MHTMRFVLKTTVILIITLLLLTLAAPTFARPPVTHIVNSTDDADDGTCDATHCSLREAINAANAAPDESDIEFNIPGSGVKVIKPLSELPKINEQTNIDGITQSGSSCPTASSPATLKIELDGSLIPASTISPDGLFLSSSADNSTIRGLAIGNFGHAIDILFADNSEVTCTHIGLRADGITTMGNHTGIQLQSATGVTVGGTDPSDRNVISGSTFTGMRINNDAQIMGNYIGTTADGSNGRPNVTGIRIDQSSIGATIGGTSAAHGNLIATSSQYGIEIFSAKDSVVRNNIIGRSATGAPLPNRYGIYAYFGASNANIRENIIVNSERNGVLVTSSPTTDTTGITIRLNEIVDNTDAQIDLGLSGINANDFKDGDAGANGLQNFPLLDSAFPLTQISPIAGSINTNPFVAIRIDLYTVAECSGDGHGGGSDHVATVTVASTDGNGDASWSFTPATALPLGHFVTATATGPDGSTSEFSPCYEIVAPAFVVNTLANNSTACVAGTDAACSLRQAIIAANANPSLNATITFAVTGTISLQSALPTITRPIVLNAAPAAGSAQCPSASDTGNLLVRLDGDALTSGNGLEFGNGSSGSSVQGLALTRFPDNGIYSDAAVDGLMIRCNLLGIQRNGSAAGNDGNGLDLNGDDNLIGLLAKPNYAAHNGAVGMLLSGANDEIEGNYLHDNETSGLRLNGPSATVISNTVMSNVLHGMLLVSADSVQISANSIISNSATGIRSQASNLVTIDGNAINNNGASGIYLLSNTFGHTISNNEIGLAGGNGTHGIQVEESTQHIVTDNVIVNNSQDGVNVDDDSTQIELRRNVIADNGGLGIDLGVNGVLTNDVGDGDFGANAGQNYPNITAVDVNSAEITFNLNSGTGSYLVEFFRDGECDASDHGEGRTYIGSVTVATGMAHVATLAPAAFGSDDTLSATATELRTGVPGNTSEFSRCFTDNTTPTAVGYSAQPTSNLQQNKLSSLSVIQAAASLLLLTAAAVRHRFWSRA